MSLWHTTNDENSSFTAWLRNDQSMPFNPNHEHLTIKLIDYDHPENNQYTVATQYTFRAGTAEPGPT